MTPQEKMCSNSNKRIKSVCRVKTKVEKWDQINVGPGGSDATAFTVKCVCEYIQNALIGVTIAAWWINKLGRQKDFPSTAIHRPW